MSSEIQLIRPYLPLRSGERYYTNLDVDVLNVNLGDIAHSLARTYRYNGQADVTVAQHCINVAYVAATNSQDRNLILQAILHDAAEAYVGDIPRPIKKELQNIYNEIVAEVAVTMPAAEKLRNFIAREEQLQDYIYEHFNVERSKNNDELIAKWDTEDASREMAWFFKIHAKGQPTFAYTSMDSGSLQRAYYALVDSIMDESIPHEVLKGLLQIYETGVTNGI